mgnify:CR=1 FL=1
MSILMIRILLIAAMPLEIYILIKGIKILRKAIHGKIVLELPLSEYTSNFNIKKSGMFSIWWQAGFLTSIPVHLFKPKIINKNTLENITLDASILSPQTNNFDIARLEVYTFSAKKGDYSIEMVEGSSVNYFQTEVASYFSSNKKFDFNKIKIQIRESQSQFMTLLGIPISLIGGGGLLLSFVLSLLADQVFI